MVTYENEDDVWEMIGDLYIEAKETYNVRGSDENDPILDVYHQLPYFCCPNVVLDMDIQSDIQRYIYCKEAQTQPYEGSYGDVPFKWLSIHFALRNSIELQQSEHRKKYQRKLEQQRKKKEKRTR